MRVSDSQPGSQYIGPCPARQRWSGKSRGFLFRFQNTKRLFHPKSGGCGKELKDLDLSQPTLLSELTSLFAGGCGRDQKSRRRGTTMNEPLMIIGVLVGGAAIGALLETIRHRARVRQLMVEVEQQVRSLIEAEHLRPIEARARTSKVQPIEELHALNEIRGGLTRSVSVATAQAAVELAAEEVRRNPTKTIMLRVEFMPPDVCKPSVSLRSGPHLANSIGQRASTE